MTGITTDNTLQKINDLRTSFFCKSPHHTKVDKCNTVFRKEKEVARVRIGMEKTIFQNHFHHYISATQR